MNATISTDFPGDQALIETQRSDAAGDQDTLAANDPPPPMLVPPQGTQTGRGQGPSDIQPPFAPDTNSPDGHRRDDTQTWPAVGGQTPPPRPRGQAAPNDVSAGVVAR